jgi:hypothetical protein
MANYSIGVNKMNKNNNYLILAIIAIFSACVLYGQSYTLPTYLSPKDVAEWTITGGFIATGSGTPTITAGIATGSLYIDTADINALDLYRFNGSAWGLVSGGTRTHSQLDGLSFATSGHTGFASAAAIPNNASFTLTGLSEKNFSSLTGKPTNASYTLTGLSEKNFSSLTGKPTNASYTLTGLSEKNFSSLTNKPTTLSGYGITDGALNASLTAHVASTTDPHGSTMTVTDELRVGSGAFTVDTYSDEDGVYVISATETKVLGYLKVLDVSEYVDNAAAIAGGLATGTIYRSGDDLKIVW